MGPETKNGTAVITNIQGFSLHDGPGIRTVVFFKGCPLFCHWCANPECRSGKPQMGFIRTLCTGCGKCLEVCPEQAIRGEGEHRIDRSRCTACGLCSEQCHYGALVRYGEAMTVDDVMDAVRRDRMFYADSGGGVTVSGGEPLLSAQFVRELFERIRNEQINTCVETCGMGSPEVLLQLIPVTDHFLFDLKLMDDDAHSRYTGCSNRQILHNAALVAGRGADVLFRQPLVPGVNDSSGNIEATARFLRSLGGNAARLQIMPFHGMGVSKYRALDLPYTMEGVASADDKHVEAVRQAYLSCGIDCTVSR
ncbi:MAG: glycyl-radical enzyme activating protein [Acidobacteria bacterium]|nr:glycyl-radical enzyme activating protein [Acidobacteriota bacterium]